MKNRRIEVSRGKTISTGTKFEFERIDVGLAVDIDDEADLNESYRELLGEVNKQLIVNTETIRGKEEERPQKGDRFRRGD